MTASSEPTYRVSELGAEIRDIFSEAFRSVWVVGEVQRPRLSQRGHLYLELIEKGSRDEIVGKLDAVLWRTDHQRIRRLLARSQQEIVDGAEIRCRCQLDFYPPGGRLQLIVREVDPQFSLGHLERRRRETLAALEAAGLLELNPSLELPELPLRVGLITSDDSAAYHDFLSGLVASGYGFEVWFRHAAMQGREAEAGVVQALTMLGALDLDAIVIIRGGGSRTDLAAFDNRRVAEAVARCPLPVLAGLGHEIDRSIVDVVSHRSFKTPTEVATFLIERLVQADLRRSHVEQALVHCATERLRRTGERLVRLGQTVRIAGVRLHHADRRIVELGRQLQQAAQRQLQLRHRDLDRVREQLVTGAPRRIDGSRERPEQVVARVADIAGGRLREKRAILSGLERLCTQLSPERILERGYSMTRNADGQLVRHPDQVCDGEPISTRLAGGTLKSRVEMS